MTTWALWYVGSFAVAAGILFASIALLKRPLDKVLRDVLGSATIARFFALVFCMALATITLAGSLLPPALLDLEAIEQDQLVLNSAKQLLAGVGTLLIGLAFLGGPLLFLIHKYEACKP